MLYSMSFQMHFMDAFQTLQRNVITRHDWVPWKFSVSYVDKLWTWRHCFNEVHHYSTVLPWFTFRQHFFCFCVWRNMRVLPASATSSTSRCNHVRNIAKSDGVYFFLVRCSSLYCIMLVIPSWAKFRGCNMWILILVVYVT